jgi:hypothetical protein
MVSSVGGLNPQPLSHDSFALTPRLRLLTFVVKVTDHTVSQKWTHTVQIKCFFTYGDSFQFADEGIKDPFKHF